MVISEARRQRATGAHLVETAAARDAAAADLAASAAELHAAAAELRAQAVEYGRLGEAYARDAARTLRDSERASRHAASLDRLTSVVQAESEALRSRAADLPQTDDQPVIPIIGLRPGAALKPARTSSGRELWVRGRMAVPSPVEERAIRA